MMMIKIVKHLGISHFCVSIKSYKLIRAFGNVVLQIDDLLKQRNEIHASYTAAPPIKRSLSKTKRTSSTKEPKEEGYSTSWKERKPVRDRLKKKKWFNIHLKVDKRKPC